MITSGRPGRGREGRGGEGKKEPGPVLSPAHSRADTRTPPLDIYSLCLSLAFVALHPTIVYRSIIISYCVSCLCVCFLLAYLFSYCGVVVLHSSLIVILGSRFFTLPLCVCAYPSYRSATIVVAGNVLFVGAHWLL